jgi:hypothetical protein
MGGPNSSYATASIALRIIWPLKPSHYFKVETPSGGTTTSALLIISALSSDFALFWSSYFPSEK